MHLEYILTELLKNSFRATVEHHDPRGIGLDVPDILITLSAPSSEPHPPSDAAGSHYFSMRIRDQGGGVSKEHMDRIFSYAFTTANSEQAKKRRMRDEVENDEPFLGVVTGRSLRTGMGTIAGLGYGLPMSSLYAK